MSKYLLDSDIIIWCLRGEKRSIDLVRKIQDERVPACCALSVIEIMLGAKKSEEKVTGAFLDALYVYAVDKGIASLAAKYIRDYKSKGQTLDFVDASIAATCSINKLVLVTYNVKHFPMPELKIYQDA